MKLNTILNRTQNSYLKIASIIFIILLFSLYSYLTVNAPPKFVSPDETAFHFFTMRFARGESIPAPLPDLKYAEVIHPRNSVGHNGTIHPVGFLGLVLFYGGIGRISEGLVPFITPLLAVIGIIFFYFLVKEIFGKTEAIISSIILALIPSYLFWSNMSFFNNMPTVSFFIGGLLFLFKYLKSDSKKFIAISAILFSLSTWFRYETSILIGIVVVLSFAFKLFKSRVNAKLIYSIILFCIIFLAVMSPILYYNTKLYGSPISVGYSILPPEDMGTGLTLLLNKALKYSLPSGFHPIRGLGNAQNYILKMLPLFTALAFLGILISLKKKKDEYQKLFYAIFFVVFTWLVLFYGSGFFYGYGVEPFIFSSYTRYFLLIYVFMSVLVGITLKKLLEINKIVFLFIFVILITSSLNFAFLSEQSLGPTQWRRHSYLAIENFVTELTAEDTIIFTRYWDKAIFPARHVVSRSFASEKNNHKTAAEVIKTYKDAGYGVYFINDKRGLYHNDLKRELNKIGFTTQTMSYRFGGIYKINYLPKIRAQ